MGIAPSAFPEEHGGAAEGSILQTIRCPHRPWVVQPGLASQGVGGGGLRQPGGLPGAAGPGVLLDPQEDLLAMHEPGDGRPEAEEAHGVEERCGLRAGHGQVEVFESPDVERRR